MSLLLVHPRREPCTLHIDRERHTKDWGGPSPLRERKGEGGKLVGKAFSIMHPLGSQFLGTYSLAKL